MLNAASLSLLIASVALAQAANKSSSDEIASPNGTLVEFPAAPASVASTPLAAPAPSLTTDDLIRWKYESRVASPSADDSTATPRWRAIALPAQVLSGARQDLADLRLIDAQDREVPFVVRTLRTISESQALNAELFNQGVVEGKQTEVRLDLGEAPTTHSQVEISTAGREFRRAVTVEGSDDGQTWTKLADGRLARFASDSSNGAGFEQHDVSYAPSRFRYLRVREIGRAHV